MTFGPRANGFRAGDRVRNIISRSSVVSARRASNVVNRVLITAEQKRVLGVRLLSVAASALQTTSLGSYSCSYTIFSRGKALKVLTPVHKGLALFSVASDASRNLSLKSLSLKADPSVRRVILRPQGASLLLILQSGAIHLISLSQPGNSVDSKIFLSPIRGFRSIIGQ